MVKFAERNFFVPVPVVSSLAELNEQLKGCCELYLSHTQTVAERLKLEQSTLLALPEPNRNIVGLFPSKRTGHSWCSLKPIGISYPVSTLSRDCG
jgi:hypothetical protein